MAVHFWEASEPTTSNVTMRSLKILVINIFLISSEGCVFELIPTVVSMEIRECKTRFADALWKEIIFISKRY